MDILDPEFLAPDVDAPTRADPASSRYPGKAQGLRELQREVDRHRLVIEVLTRALIDKGLYTRDQLNALANLVDMEDGVRDGKIQPKQEVKHCSNCKRVMMNVSGTCLYCGHQEVLDIL